MKRLPRRRKYLGTFFDYHVSPENSQHLSQKLFGETDSDISTPRLYSAHGQANNLAFRKEKTKATNKTC